MITDNKLHCRVEDSTSVTLSPVGDELILTGWVKIKTKGLLDFELIDWKDSIRIPERISTEK